ncbi:MAG: hypothetical protein NVS2B6_19670 [Thermoleophilaceae bacterium]
MVASPFAGRWRPLRVVWLLVVYLTRDILATAACFGLWVASGFGRSLGTPRMQRAHYAVVKWFLSGLYKSGVSMLGLGIELERSEAAEAALGACRRPVIVFSRHKGAGDSFLLVHLLLSRYGRLPRIVMKGSLQFDPLIDAFGNRLPNCFITPGGGHHADAVCTLARGLGDDGALVIFPEGGNFTEERRERAIEQLEQDARPEEAEVARGIEHLSAPKPGGALAAIEGSPQADIVFVAHSGLPDLASATEVWRAMPMTRPVSMRMWLVAANEIPAGEEERIDWLFDWWQRLDRWLDDDPAPEQVRVSG